jgi:hypothetical protein
MRRKEVAHVFVAMGLAVYFVLAVLLATEGLTFNPSFEIHGSSNTSLKHRSNSLSILLLRFTDLQTPH